MAVVVVLVGGRSSAYAHKATITEMRAAGISRLPDDTRMLTVNAQTAGAPTDAVGSVQFTRQSPPGLSRFRGSVTRLNTEVGFKVRQR